MFDLQSDSLVGVRVNSSSNVMLLIISNSAQSIADVNASAERALQHLVKLKPTDPVMVVEQHGFPQTFVPQEYPLGVVTNIVRDLGGMLMTKQKGDSVLGAVSAARTTGVGRVQHPELLSPPVVVHPPPAPNGPPAVPSSRGAAYPYLTITLAHYPSETGAAVVSRTTTCR